MKKTIFTLMTATAFVASLCCCSQTVEAPSTDDEEEISQNKDEKSSDDNQDENGKPSDEKGNSKDSGEKDIGNTSDNEGMDMSNFFADFPSEGETSFSFTQKIDCDFSADDEKWFIKKTTEEDIGDMTFTFDEKAMHIFFEATGRDSTEEQCQGDITAWYFVFAILEGTDVEASCDGLEFTGSGKFEDPTRPISKKKEVYAELCN